MNKLLSIVGLALILVACQVTQPVPVTTTNTPVVLPTSQGSSLTSPVPPGQCRIRGVLPDPVCTPGTVNTAVTQSTKNTTICVSGWTKTIRPPASYTDNLKALLIARYGYTDTAPRLL